MLIVEILSAVLEVSYVHVKTSVLNKYEYTFHNLLWLQTFLEDCSVEKENDLANDVVTGINVPNAEMIVIVVGVKNALVIFVKTS